MCIGTEPVKISLRWVFKSINVWSYCA